MPQLGTSVTSAELEARQQIKYGALGKSTPKDEIIP